jgi:uncharacterized protein YodC (DUF2158 family)
MSNDLHGDDLLRRKGGGPVMMVINPEGAVGEVWCIWFKDGRLVKDAFSPIALEKASDARSSNLL